MVDKRSEHLKRFYLALEALEVKLGGKRFLCHCNGATGWPKRGIYFFFEHGEMRSNSGEGLRVVRVGTHALSQSSKTTLWNRLSQHRGVQKTGGGNHRGSIFRLLIGISKLTAESQTHETWGKGSSASRDIRESELKLEKKVSATIGAMPFLWLDVDSLENGPNMRSFIERNSIALLSNYSKPAQDLPSQNWLGNNCNREKVRVSGLWNSNHVDESYDPDFLDLLEKKISEMRVIQ